MATRIKPKRSETSSSVPTTSNLAVGEIAINSADQKIYTRDSNDNIVTLAQPGLLNVVEDTTPQLGGDLDVNGNSITGSTITLDATVINLDASDNQIYLKDNGNEFGRFVNNGGNLQIKSSSSGTTAITLTGADVEVAGDLTVDTDTLYVDSSNNRVGIGTTSPTQALTISGGNLAKIAFTDGGFQSIYYGDAGSPTAGFVHYDHNSDNYQVDVLGTITLDAPSGIKLSDNNTQYGQLEDSSNDFVISSVVSDKDIIFKGNDGGSTITALTLDMSEGGNASFNNDVTVGNNLVVTGDLTVSGTTTTVNTETINLADNVIVLNSNATGSATENAGIEVERGDDANKTLIWNETTDKWTVGTETFNACTLEVDDGSTTWPISSKSDNLHIGTDASCSLTTGANNIAVGCQSLKLNEDGTDNVAIGQNSLCCATTPSTNIVIGKNSLCASDECTYTAGWNGSSYPTVTCSTTKNIVIGNDLLKNEIVSSYNTVIGNDIATCASSCVFTYGCTCTCNGQSAIPYTHFKSFNNTLIGNCIAPFAGRVDKSVVLGSNIAFSTSNTCPILCSQIFGYNILNCAMTDCGGNGFVTNSFLAGSNMFENNSAVCHIDATIAIGDSIGVPGDYTCKRTGYASWFRSVLLGDYTSQFGTTSETILIGTCGGKTLRSNNLSVFIGTYAGEGNLSCNNTRCTHSNCNVAIGTYAMGQVGYNNTTTPLLNIYGNTGVGFSSLYYVSGYRNTALGSNSGYNTTSGFCNTTLGSYSGCCITTGACNTFIGDCAGHNLTVGNNNIVIGSNIQTSSNTVSNETTIGGACLRFPGISSSSGQVLCYNGTHWVAGTPASGGICNVVEDTTPQLGGDLDVNGNQITSSSNGNITINPNGTGCVIISKIDVFDCSCFQGSHPTGFENIQLGTQAGQYWATATGVNANCIQCCNTAIGGRALRNHCHGDNNVAIGHSPLLFQISASDNVAVGSMAGYCNVSGERNVFIGHQSGFNSLGCCNTTLGYAAGNTITSGCNVTVLGYQAQPSSATVSNEITLGDANITSFRIPGLQSGASDGQVLTYCSTNGNIVFKDGGCNWDPLVSGALCNIYISNTACSLSSGGLCNTVVGHLAGCSLTTSDRNTLIGVCAGMKLEGSSTCNNVAVGNGALAQVEEGNHNVAVGFCVMGGCTPGTNSKGCYNIALGQRAGFCLANGGNCNVLIGRDTAYNLTTGDQNIAIGIYAMYCQTVGSNQVAIGSCALRYVSGGNNVALGASVLQGDSATQGSNSAGGNVGVGISVMSNITTGVCNTALGMGTANISSGSCNVIVGAQSGRHGVCKVTGDCNIIVGSLAGNSLSNDNSGSNNIIIGHGADFSGTLDGTCSNVIILGNSSHNQLIMPGLSAGQGQTLCFNGTGFVAADSAGVTPWQAVCTANFTAVAGLCYFVNTTSAAITATLPASASLGDQIHFKDYNDTFDTNNLTVGRNSHNIEGSAADLTVATEGAGFTLVYVDSTRGWVLKDV
jgi:hypothetical protein